MQHTFNLRTIVTCCAALLLFYACNKTENPVREQAVNAGLTTQLGCCPKPGCDVRTLLISPGNEISYSVHYPEAYKYTKTYGADGRVNYMDGFFGVHWSFHQFKGPIKYSGNTLYMLDDVGDTLVVAKLNGCSQPVTATIYKRFPGEPPFATDNYKYHYDYKGRLSKLVTISDPSTPPSVNIYQYDRFDNVTRISLQGDTSKYITYTYDYRRPIKGGIYEQGINHAIGWHLLEMLGHLNTQPHHLLTRVRNHYDYPEETWPYTDQVVDAKGYLVSYKANLYNNETVAVKGEIVWKCGKGGDSTIARN